MADTASSAQDGVEPSGFESTFFPIVAGVILLIAFIGFSRTFYLRPLIDTSSLTGRQELPGFVVLHGAIFTSWIVLFFAQSWLGASKKLRLHRKLGVAGAVIAVAVFLSGLQVTLNGINEALESGRPLGFLPAIVRHNIVSMLSFAAFVALAIYWRRTAASHKRLMFYATLSMLGPAISPGGRPLGEFLVEFIPRPDATIIICLIIALLIRDLISERRLHRVTPWGGAVIVAKYLLVPIVFSNAAVESAILRLA